MKASTKKSLTRLWLGVWVLSLILNCSKKEEAVEEAVQAEEGNAPENAAEGDDASAGEGEAAPTDEAATAEAPAPEVDAAAAAAAPAPVASTPAEAAPIADGNALVMYVKANGTKVFSQPNNGSAPVAELEKGDHMLVVVEGSWAKLQNNTYIPMKSLSQKGIGRDRTAGGWSTGK